MAETLKRLGLTTAVICPGSRSTPLAIAFAQAEAVDAIPILDERSASFFALGIARKSRLPVALICTSGTAGANFYPAVIEARESRVPLLVLTADRPPRTTRLQFRTDNRPIKIIWHIPKLVHRVSTAIFGNRDAVIFAANHRSCLGAIAVSCSWRSSS